MCVYLCVYIYIYKKELQSWLALRPISAVSTALVAAVVLWVVVLLAAAGRVPVLEGHGMPGLSSKNKWGLARTLGGSMRSKHICSRGALSAGPGRKPKAGAPRPPPFWCQSDQWRGPAPKSCSKAQGGSKGCEPTQAQHTTHHSNKCFPKKVFCLFSVRILHRRRPPSKEQKRKHI